MTASPEQDCAGSRAVRPVRVPAERARLLRAGGPGMLHGGGPPRISLACTGVRRRVAVSEGHRRRRGSTDPLDDEVVRSYWVGGPLLDKVDSAELLSRLRKAFTGQVTGLLGDLPATAQALAHHSFHVFVVYPWVRFLDRDPTTPLRVMQDCRIRWGTVESVDGRARGDHVAPVVIRGRCPGAG